MAFSIAERYSFLTPRSLSPPPPYIYRIAVPFLPLPVPRPCTRSAALQALGNLIVHGSDPPDALAALLDSLRNDPSPDPTGNLAEGGGGGGGSDSGGVGGSGDRKTKGLAGRVMGSLPLWARRLKKRSDAVHEQEEETLVVSRQASRNPAGDSAEAAVAAEEDEEDEEASSLLATAVVVASPTLYGECLEVAAIKALAAPGEPLPVRFFAALASATTSAGSGGGDGTTGADDNVDGRTSAAAASVVPTDVAEDISTVTLFPTGTSASTETSPGTPGTCAGEEHQSGSFSSESAAAGAGTAVEGEARTGGRRKRSEGWSRRRRRSTLAGVLQIVRGRMTGQARLSEDLLGDEVTLGAYAS